MPDESVLHDPQAFEAAVRESGVPNRPILFSHGRGWTGLVALCAHVSPHPAFASVPETVHSAAEFITVQMGGTGHLRCRCDGRESAAQGLPGGVCVIPRGAPSAWSWDGEADVFQVYLEAPLMESLVDEIGRGDPSRVELRYRFNARDPLVEQIALSLRAELQQEGPAGRLYVETLARAVGLHLLRTGSSLTSRASSQGRGLAHWQLQRAVDYIDANLGTPFGIDDLAAAVGLTPWYFIRQFKSATGQTPYQYVLRCRVERARDLLREGQLTAADVAQRVGFGEQGQLGWHMKRLLGVLPRDVIASARIAKN